ncbi:hypothetical protein DYB30_013553, partial [Aphanomyces astaci]
STCSMLKRYVAIGTYTRLLGDRNIFHLIPNDDEDDDIDALLLVLDDLESATLALQEEATSILDVRNLFDECTLLYPSASNAWRPVQTSSDTRILKLESPRFGPINCYHE